MSAVVLPAPVHSSAELLMTESPRGPVRMRPARWKDVAFEQLTRLFALLVLGILAAILVTLVLESRPSLDRFGLAFLWHAEWDPVQERFGALVPIYGTLVTSLIAMLIGIPVSFGIALFLTELSPAWLKRPLGIGMLTAGLILSIMVIPFIAAVMRDVFDLVPALLKESAYGLGATTWEVVWKVVLPYTKVGVIGGVMLGLGRALGETMAVTFVIGNAHRLSASLMAPGNSIASALANEFTEAVGDLYFSALIELGLILFLITTVVLALAKFLLLRLALREGART